MLPILYSLANSNYFIFANYNHNAIFRFKCGYQPEGANLKQVLPSNILFVVRNVNVYGKNRLVLE